MSSHKHTSGQAAAGRVAAYKGRLERRGGKRIHVALEAPGVQALEELRRRAPPAEPIRKIIESALITAAALPNPQIDKP